MAGFFDTLLRRGTAEEQRDRDMARKMQEIKLQGLLGSQNATSTFLGGPTYDPQGNSTGTRGPAYVPPSINQQLFANNGEIDGQGNPLLGGYKPKSLLESQTPFAMDRKRELLGQINPEAPLQKMQSQLYPAPPRTGMGKPGEVLVNLETGESIGPGIPALPKEFEPTNMQRPGTDQMVMARTPDDFDKYSRAGFVKAGTSVPGAKAPAAPKDTFDQETKLRSEFDAKAKDFTTIRDSYATIQDIASNPSAAGDIALVYNFMKIQDPNSAIKEGEYATAENARGVPEWVRGQWNKLQDGQFLSPNQRRDFTKQAGLQYGTRLKQYKQDEARYRDLAKSYGVSEEKVVYDRSGGIKPVASPMPVKGFVEDGYEFLGGDPASQSSWRKVAK